MLARSSTPRVTRDSVSRDFPNVTDTPATIIRRFRLRPSLGDTVNPAQ